MNFILIDGRRRSNAIQHIMGLDLSELHEVAVKPFKDSRSKSQNRLYWMWIPYLADYCGYTNNQMHRVLKVKFIGTNKEIIDGVEIVEPKSSRKLKVKEFTNYLREIEALAIDYGITLPHPDIYNYAMMREV